MIELSSMEITDFKRSRVREVVGLKGMAGQKTEWGAVFGESHAIWEVCLFLKICDIKACFYADGND